MKLCLVALAFLASASAASAYDLKNLSPQDVLVIGRGLDKLPREETDAGGLYQRLQSQITEQNQAAEKGAAAKRKAEIDAAVKAKTEPADKPADKGDEK